MSLAHALLTALAERPCSGSELAGRFDRSIGYFWQATHQQIYRELAALETAGWVESLDPGPGRGRRRAYRLLPAGREELRRWVGEARDPRPIRDDLMVALRAEAVVGPTGLADVLAERLGRHRAKLAHFRAIETKDFPTPPTAREQRLRHLVLKAGIAYEAEWVATCEEALAILAGDGPDGEAPPGPP